MEAYYSVTRSGLSVFPMVWWQVQFIHCYLLYFVEVIKFERILYIFEQLIEQLIALLGNRSEIA